FGYGCMAFAPDGKTIAIPGWGTFLLDVATGKEVRQFKVDGRLRGSQAFSPDGKYLATASHYGIVRLWEVATGRQVWQYRVPTGLFQGGTVAFSQDGRWLVGGNWNETCVYCWKMPPGPAPVYVLRAEVSLHCAAVSPDGRSVAAGSGNDVLVWELATGQLRQR